jgi:hypothetical protein
MSTTPDWLKEKSWHRIRNEMLVSPAWKAASHLQRSMVFALVSELGRHKGKDNGHLIFTDRDLREFGFSFGAIKPNLIALSALGFIAYKAGRPGLKGYGKARRYRLTFMPMLDSDGKEVEPPTDEWAHFTTTKEAKVAVRRARNRAQSSQNRYGNRSTSVVLRKSEHLAQNGQPRVEREVPSNIESASQKSKHYLHLGNQSLQQYATVEAGPIRYVLSTDPQARGQFSFVGRGRYPIGNVIPFGVRAA